MAISLPIAAPRAALLRQEMRISCPSNSSSYCEIRCAFSFRNHRISLPLLLTRHACGAKLRDATNMHKTIQSSRFLCYNWHILRIFRPILYWCTSHLCSSSHLGGAIPYNRCDLQATPKGSKRARWAPKRPQAGLSASLRHRPVPLWPPRWFRIVPCGCGQ